MAKILVVDDETNSIVTVQMQLEANGYEVISANNGEEGLEKVKNEKPDLIILDVMMPKMNGYQVCAILKHYAQSNKIPIILITGKAQDEFRELGQRVGADDFITKPFEPPILLAKIEELLKKSSESISLGGG